MLGPVLPTSRTCATMNVELVVLRHEVAVLLRTNPRPRTHWADRPYLPPRRASNTTQSSGVRARADQPATMPTTRLIVVARMTVPKTSDNKQCRRTIARMLVLATLVSETW